MVNLGDQGLPASRRIARAGQFPHERTESRIEIADLQATTFPERAKLDDDALGEIFTRGCHLFVISRYK
jgi:hypothetical protein